MDPLSEVLSLLKPRAYSSGGFQMPRSLAIQFPHYEGIKCYAVVSGQCWLSLEDVPEAALLDAGDCFLLPSGRAFRLATDPAAEPVGIWEFLAKSQARGVGSSPGGGHPDGCYLAGGHFLLSGDPADSLLRSLSPIVHLRKDSDKAAMRWSLERMKEELRDPQPGGYLAVQQLAYLMLLQALRLHLAEGVKGGRGWLFALADKQISAAIAGMHDEPARRWTLQDLAERAGMSRSIFALRFKEAAGATPMEYLTRWRMLVAGDKLKNSADSIGAIARSLGYDSESAFGKAFRRLMGCSPSQHRRRGHAASPGPSAQAVPLRERQLAAAL